jgi:deoxycytidylate deaminase
MELHDLQRIATTEASKSNCKFKLGCVALSRGQVIAKGFNRYKQEGQPIYSKSKHCHRKGNTIHAEQICLRRTGRSNIDELVVVRIGEIGYSMSMPCKICYAHAKRSGVKRIWYTDWTGKMQKMTL